MKKLLLLAVFCLCLSCSPCQAAYYTFRLIAPAENAGMRYATEDIYFSFALAKKNPDRLFISIYNRTEQPLRVDWAKASLIFGQKAQSLLPASQLRPDYNSYNAPAASNIPPGALLEESLFAESSLTLVRSSPVTVGGFGGRRYGWGGWVGFDDFYRVPGYIGWKIQPFFPKNETHPAWNGIVGYKFALFLPVTVNDTESNYRFDFEIISASADISPGVLGLFVTDRIEQEILQKPPSIEQGVLVLSLSKKSAAKRAGLLPGDNIIKIDDAEIRDAEDFFSLLNKKSAKETIKITFLRQNKEHSLPVKLGKA